MFPNVHLFRGASRWWLRRPVAGGSWAIESVAIESHLEPAEAIEAARKLLPFANISLEVTLEVNEESAAGA